MPGSLSPRGLLIALLLQTSSALAGEAPQVLSLDEVTVRFREASPTAEALDARLAEARATARLATAPFQPILAVQGGYTRNNAEARVSIADVFSSLSDALPFDVEIDTSGFPDDLIIQPLQQWSAGASLTVPIVAPSAWADATAARQVANATSDQVTGSRQQAEAGLVRLCWLSEAAEQVSAAADHAAEVAREHRDATQRRFEAGLAPELEVLVAETELSRRESERLQAAADRDRARRTVGAMIGVSGPVDVSLPDPAPGVVPDAETAAARAQDRPAVDGAATLAKATRTSMTSAWLRHLPTLAGNAAFQAQDIAFPTGQKTAWRVGLQLTWVLYDGGARYGMLDVARARHVAAEAGHRQALLDADREARDAVEAVRVAEGRLTLAAQAMRTADAAEAAAGRGYDAGLVSHTDVLDAQQRRLEASVARAGAAAQLGAARAELLRATGQGWSAP